MESVSGGARFTIAAGDWRRFGSSARRNADGTGHGRWGWIGGIATSGLNSTPPNRVAWRVMDDGNGQSAQPDQINDQYYSSNGTLPAWYCASKLAWPGLHDIEAGNIKTMNHS